MTITNDFQRILKEYKEPKPNKIWVDKGSGFYNSSFKKWLKDNDTEMYSIHNEGKSVAAERFIRTLKTKIQKYLTSISKNVYIDKLDDIANEYNNTDHKTIKMKPVDVKDNTCIDFKKEVHKFEVGDHVRISKYKIFLPIDTHENGEKNFLELKKLKIQFLGHMLLMISKVKELLEHFMKKNYKRLINKNLGQKK